MRYRWSKTGSVANARFPAHSGLANIAQTRMNLGFGIKQFEHRVFDCCYLQQIPFFAGAAQSQTTGFRLMDTTIEEVHDAYKSHRLAVRQLVQLYLNR